MHSESLSFIFKNEFGFDTLTVNGCFECSPKNFSKVSIIQNRSIQLSLLVSIPASLGLIIASKEMLEKN